MQYLTSVLSAVFPGQTAMWWLLAATLFVAVNVLLAVMYLYAMQLSMRSKLIHQGISCMPISLLGVAASFSAHTHLATEKFEDAERKQDCCTARHIPHSVTTQAKAHHLIWTSWRMRQENTAIS